MVGTDDLLKVRGNLGFFFWVIEVCICWNESFGVLDFIFFWILWEDTDLHCVFFLRIWRESWDLYLGSLFISSCCESRGFVV